MFDTTRQIEMKLLGGAKIRLRFPTDEEWQERQRRRKIIVRSLGRGTSENSVPNAEVADAELLAKIRLDSDGPPVDEFEAMRVVARLAAAQVTDAVVEPGAVRVMLRVPGAETEHVVSTPSAKDVIEYRRGAVRILDRKYGQQELTMLLSAAAPLYDRLAKATGYTGAVPIVHKDAVIQAAIDALESDFGDATENF